MIIRAEEYHLEAEIETKECRIAEDERLRIQPSLERLGKAVSEFPESKLCLTIVHHPRSNLYHARAKLKVPGQTIISGEHNPLLSEATIRCLEKVLRRVETYKASPDTEALNQAQRRAELANQIIAPTDSDTGKLGEAVKAGDYHAFRRALLSQEEPLRMRVGRWVQRYPAIQDEVGRTFEIADLVEEVFLLAFEQYCHRPTHLRMQEWLDSLIDPAVKTFWSAPDERVAASFAQSLVRERL